MSFGEQMRLRREALALSRAQLAARLGVSPSAISNYENGLSSPKEEVLLRLFDALDVDPNYLFRGFFHAEHGAYSREEQDLIAAYRALPPLGRESVRGLIASLGALCRAQAAEAAPEQGRETDEFRTQRT